MDWDLNPSFILASGIRQFNAATEKGRRDHPGREERHPEGHPGNPREHFKPLNIQTPLPPKVDFLNSRTPCCILPHFCPHFGNHAFQGCSWKGVRRISTLAGTKFWRRTARMIRQWRCQQLQDRWGCWMKRRVFLLLTASGAIHVDSCSDRERFTRLSSTPFLSLPPSIHLNWSCGTSRPLQDWRHGCFWLWEPVKRLKPTLANRTLAILIGRLWPTLGSWLWPNCPEGRRPRKLGAQTWKKWGAEGWGPKGWVAAKFGRTWFGHSYLAAFGQTEFGQYHIWAILFWWGPEGVGAWRGGGPEG